MKRLITDILVVFMGLVCGLWLNHTEMMGDRVAALLVAALIVITSLQSDLVSIGPQPWPWLQP